LVRSRDVGFELEKRDHCCLIAGIARIGRGDFLPKMATHYVRVAPIAHVRNPAENNLWNLAIAAVGSLPAKTQAFIKRRCGSDGL
jgi:hypothetical protein